MSTTKKLLQRKVDPALVSQLIEMPAFNLLIVQLGAAKRGTFDAGYDSMMEVFGAANELLTEHLRTTPGDRQAAKIGDQPRRGLPRKNHNGITDDVMA